MTDSAFRLGDVRGIYPDEVNEDFAYRFAQAFAKRFRLKGNIATGRDVRASSLSLHEALNQGFLSAGIDVVDLGICPTEIGSFASTRANIQAAIIVTASHNALDFNGFKCILASGNAVTYDTGLGDIEKMLLKGPAGRNKLAGQLSHLDLRPMYLKKIQNHFNFKHEYFGQIALNGLNGTASTLATSLAQELDIDVAWFRQEPGPMPHEGADPAQPSLAAEMKSFMQGRDFELGVAWDGDCDRCVFFDADGNLIPTYYMIGLFARHILATHPGGAIVYDTKLCWNTLQIIQESGGVPVKSETGHAFVKQKMRQYKAVYGGELSSHHYFSDFYYCDSGMLAWLKCLELVQQSGISIAELIQTRRMKFRCTPEISLNLKDVDRAFSEINETYSSLASHKDEFDGISYEMPDDWRFSLHRSKTEALVRFNFESRSGNDAILDEAAKLLTYLKQFQADDCDWLDQLVFQ